MLWRNAVAGLSFILLGLIVTEAMAFPTGQCVLNGDKSQLSLVVSNSSDQSYACTASCQYKVAGERPLLTLGCNYALAANAAEKVACDVDGNGPDHFGELLPTKFTCQPR